MIVPLDTAKGDKGYDYIDVLPGGKVGLMQVWRGSVAQNEIAALSLKTGKITKLLKGTYARFLPPDKLLYGTSEGRVFAVSFDEDKLTIAGDPVQVLDGIQGEPTNGTVQFAVSRSGTLVYIPGSAADRRLVWVGRDGVETPIDSTWTGAFSDVSLSPDGSRLATTIASEEGSAVWVKRLPNGSLTRLSFGGAADRPAWTPDGRTVGYLATHDEKRTAWMRRADGSDEERSVNSKAPQLDEITFSPDGRMTVFRSQGTVANSRKLLVATFGVDSAPRPLVHTEYDNFGPVLSPNGKWLAYTSNESRQNEVYVRPFPSVDSARWTVSVNGGAEPRWSRSGRELFYRTIAGDVMTVPIATGEIFQPGTPAKLFQITHLLSDPYHQVYDVGIDDKRFVMVRTSQRNAQTLGVVINWGTEIRRGPGPR